MRKKVNNTYQNIRIIFSISNDAYAWVLPDYNEEALFSIFINIIKIRFWK